MLLSPFTYHTLLSPRIPLHPGQCNPGQNMAVLHHIVSDSSHIAVVERLIELLDAADAKLQVQQRSMSPH